MLISNRNSCKKSKLKVFLVFRLSALYISFTPVSLLFYSFISEELIFIKSSRLVIAHKIKFHAPSARETINFKKIQIRLFVLKACFWCKKEHSESCRCCIFWNKNCKFVQVYHLRPISAKEISSQSSREKQELSWTWRRIFLRESMFTWDKSPISKKVLIFSASKYTYIYQDLSFNHHKQVSALASYSVNVNKHRFFLCNLIRSNKL